MGPLLVNKAVSYIEQNANKKLPFFMYYCSQAVHAPHAPAAELNGIKIAGTNRANPKDKLNPIVNPGNPMLFNMETDVEENTNVAKQHPEIVEKLKKHLAEIIQSGRSNSGERQPTDLNNPALKWKQLDVVKTYLR
jgi:hypothetical protein